MEQLVWKRFMQLLYDNYGPDTDAYELLDQAHKEVEEFRKEIIKNGKENN